MGGVPVTHHQFGSVAGDEETGGTFSLGDSILIAEHTTVAVDTIQQGRSLPVVALQLVGRVNKSDDTVQAVWLLPIMDAGQIAGALHNAVRRIGTSEADADFLAGFAQGDPP